MTESINTELDALLRRREELYNERAELECEVMSWKKDPTLSEYEKKQIVKAEKDLAESDKKMLLSETKLVQIRKNWSEILPK
ncbi:MAG: hypothetical protein FJ356_01105 [Thaumarchaeota archaeon]|nr:hypothetical protein [Nitrososphaerota archaeon]